MKDKAINPGVAFGMLAVLVVGIAVLIYLSVFKGPAQIDATTVPAERLLDPDLPRQGAK